MFLLTLVNIYMNYDMHYNMIVVIRIQLELQGKIVTLGSVRGDAFSTRTSFHIGLNCRPSDIEHHSNTRTVSDVQLEASSNHFQTLAAQNPST